MTQINAFHTNSDAHRPEDKKVYHDQSECGYGKEIKRHGHDVPGEDGRRRCEHCDDLA